MAKFVCPEDFDRWEACSKYGCLPVSNVFICFCFCLGFMSLCGIHLATAFLRVRPCRWPLRPCTSERAVLERCATEFSLRFSEAISMARMVKDDRAYSNAARAQDADAAAAHR